MLDYRHNKKLTLIGFCTGAVAGLATITPGSGFVSSSSSLVFGLVGAGVCNLCVSWKSKYHFDDALDVFAVHYVGGLIGLILTGIFAQQSIIGLSYPVGATEVPLGGWLDGNYRQVLVQLAAIGSVTAWSFVVTYGILVVMDKIPGLRLRLKDDEEELGTDMAQMGETAYGFMPLMMRNLDEESGLGSMNSKGANENNSTLRLNNLLVANQLAINGGAGTPASSGASTLGKGGNTDIIRAGGSTTTLNLDLHVPRSDEDEDHPRRLPQMTEGPANRQNNRLSRVPSRHDKNEYAEDDTESDSGSEGR